MSLTETAALMRRLNTQYNLVASDIDDCAERQARGEDVDEAEFVDLLKNRQVIQNALQAVVKLENKTLHTVLNEAK